MQPVGSQILFKPHPSEEMSEGGLFIPENAREVSNKGTIVLTGRGTHNKPMKLKAGQVGYRVFQWGEPLLIDNVLHFLMDESAIIALD